MNDEINKEVRNIKQSSYRSEMKKLIRKTPDTIAIICLCVYYYRGTNIEEQRFASRSQVTPSHR